MFLTRLGCKWRYEFQGFNLGLRGRYLPDFWIPYGDGEGEWIEVKAFPPTAEEQGKLVALVEQTGNRAFCLCGDPWPGEHRVYVWQHHRNGKPKRIPFIVSGELVERQANPEDVAFVFASDGYRSIAFPCGGWGENKEGALLMAFSAARQARFEHGEKP